MAQMKKSIKILLLLLLIIVFLCGSIFWVDNSLNVGDYRTIHNHDSDLDLAFAFATDLRINHPDAYDMIDPSLKPRLDEWMEAHKIQKCVREADYFLISNGSNEGKKIEFGCFTDTSYLSYEVDDIVIKDLKVVDWGAVKEGTR
jgi:hypothetical protein